MNLVTALVQEQEFNYIGRVLGENLKYALWPWSPGEVTIYRGDNAHGAYWLVKTELLPKYLFRFEMHRWRDPMELLFDIADKAFYFFRERPCLPVDDHIILGEN